jgi:oxygen-independent coproporphyrinogen-3 oxidase
MRASSVYVHVPFCESKCPYCAFKSEVGREGDEDVYLRALEDEISRRSPCAGTIDTLYIGGGTPSALSLCAWRVLLDVLESSFAISDSAEVTVEANPGSLTTDHIRLWRGWRVNRVSIGAQSFNDWELGLLGRRHSAAQAEDAAASCGKAGFDVSLDLMFGLPGQTLREWAGSLRAALALEPRHISIYQLTIEPGTPFHEKNPDLPDGYAQYRYAQWRLAARGYDQYEVASFAPPGGESRHNMNYWADGEYIGVGPSAWSCLDGTRSGNAAALLDYAAMIGNGGDATVFEERLDGERAARQAAVLALRTRAGIDWGGFTARYGERSAHAIRRDLLRFPPALVSCDDNRASLTPGGMRVGNAIWSELI